MIAVLAGPTGALVAWAPTVEQLPAPGVNSTVRTLDQWDAPPALPYEWSPAALNWVVPPTAAKPLLTQREFMARWRASGLGAVLSMIFALEVKDSAQGAAAREWLTEFRTARGIDPSDPDTIANTDGVLALAVGAGVVTQAQADAGRPTVLAPL